MVQLTTVFSLFLAASGLVSALPSPATETKGTIAAPPAGHPNGIYIVNIADDDSTTWELIGSINETLKETLLASREVDSLEKRDGAKCNGFGTPADDINVAQGIFADQCGNGFSWNGRTIAVYYNTAVAFGCNYAGDKNFQMCKSSDVWNDFWSINGQCGFTHGGQAGAGWYEHRKLKVNYGRSSKFSGFC